MDKSVPLEVVDLGNAKEVTQGPFTLVLEEDHPEMIYRSRPPG